MAIHIVTHSCGHTSKHEVWGNDSKVQKQLALYASEKCFRCYTTNDRRKELDEMIQNQSPIDNNN